MDQVEKIRFKLVFIENYEVNEPYSYDYGGIASAAHDFEWRELSEDEFNDLKTAVNHYNTKNRNATTSVLIIRDPSNQDLTLLMSDHALYMKEVERKKQLEKQKAEEAKAKRDAKAVEKKKRQMEKLRKEIEAAQKTDKKTD